MKIPKQKFLILTLSTLLIILVSYLYAHFAFRVRFIDRGNYFDKAAVIEFTKELNRLSKAANYPDFIDVYTGNFVSNDIPDIKNSDHTNILLLGSRTDIDVHKAKNFDFVFVSTLDLIEHLKRNGINSFYLPQFARKAEENPSKCVLNPRFQNCYWLVVGEQPEFVTYLKAQNIRFRYYTALNLDDALGFDDFANLGGVAVANEFYHEDSLDISPFWIKALQHRIPLIVFNPETVFNNLITFFNNTIPAYSSFDDIPFAFDNRLNLDSALAVIDNYLVAPAAAHRVFDIIQNKDSRFQPIKDFVAAWTPSPVFSYNSYGDYSIANDLLYALKPYFKYTSVIFPSSVFEPFGEVNIYFRGLLPLPKPNGLSLVYFIYPAFDPNSPVNKENLVQSFGEFGLYDAVISASYPVYEELKKTGFQAYYVPQFTNIDRFYPDYDENVQSEVLFVGNKYFDRLSVPILLKNNIDVDVYGLFWDGIEKSYVIDNRILRKYYSSAKIVLNDTRADMRKFGFISNRIFDATACETLVISDYMKEIEEIYGDSIPMWKTEEELVALVKYYLAPEHEAERLLKAKRAREITLNNFTSDIVAQKFQAIIDDVKKKKELK